MPRLPDALHCSAAAWKYTRRPCTPVADPAADVTVTYLAGIVERLTARVAELERRADGTVLESEVPS